MTYTHPELAQIDVEAMTRSAFLVRGALAAGAVYGTGAVSPFVGRALALSPDVEILNFALTLEHLETAFFSEGVEKVKGLSGETKQLATRIRDDERAHVETLTEAIKELGGKPVKPPKGDFGGAFASEKAFLELALTFEETGVSAYNGAGPSITSPEILASSGTIVQIEARHAALLRLTMGQPPAPDAFDKALGKDAVLKRVMPLIQG